MSDGQIIYNSEGTETKAFYVQDGLGLQALKQSGIILAIITGRSSAMVDRRAKELGISHIIQGQDDKLTALVGLAKKLGIELSHCAYIGDDLPDLKLCVRQGLGSVYPNGCEQTGAVSDYITTKTGVMVLSGRFVS